VLCAVYVFAFVWSHLHTGAIGSLWRHALVRVSVALLLPFLRFRIVVVRFFVLYAVSICCFSGAIFPVPSYPGTIAAFCGVICTSDLGVET
jgi:hypothetical protein